MKTYSGLPQALLKDWAATTETHPALQRVGFHYHDVDEWLEVMRGEITFFSISGQAWPLAVGNVFQIPRGEVHRADIGAGGVEYRMYLPLAMTGAVANRLSDDELDMLRTNLEFPIREENTDGRAAEYFAEHLSDALVFCRADASVVDKTTYRSAFTARGRSSSGTLAILNRAENGILLSTVVTTGTGGASPKPFTNVRLFVKEDGAWRCRLWVNFPA
jgi:hypothetical protein